MPEIPDVIPTEVIDTIWGNDIRDRVVSRYDNDAARSASEPFPQDGQITWLDDPGSLEYFDGTDWLTILTLDQTDARYLQLTGGSMVGDQALTSSNVKNIVAQDTEPVSPDIGLVWLDTS